MSPGAEFLSNGFARGAHRREPHAPEDRRDRSIGGVTAVGDADEAIERGQAGGVEDEPLFADVRFEAGMEIRRLKLVRVSSKVARGNRERAAQRDAEMGEIAADAGALRDGVESGRLGVGGAAQVLDVLVDPFRDRGDAIVRVFDGAELAPGKPAEAVGLAVTAREKIGDRRSIELRDRHAVDLALRDGPDVRVDGRGVADGEVLGVACIQPDKTIFACGREELFTTDGRLDVKVFLDNRLARRAERMDVEDERAALLDGVVELGTDEELHRCASCAGMGLRKGAGRGFSRET